MQTPTLKSLQSQINELKNRNLKVDANKAWETSKTRKTAIMISTYMTIAIFFVYTNAPNPFTSAIVPTLGFLLSTLALDWIRKIWEKK